ncbi:MAG: hypothetical protein H7067_19945 [Burkholderiales bacterium]|nr:hypothetical protein [Opitutaceae bacterium]
MAQYARWVASWPDWPARLIELGGAFAGAGVTAALRVRRKSLGLTAARTRLMQGVCGGALGGSRLDTFACDAVLPLLAARMGEGANGALEERWRAWTPGDAPAELLRLAREFEVSGGRGEPLGQGDLQGLLGWLASLSPAGGRGT